MGAAPETWAFSEKGGYSSSFGWGESSRKDK